MSCQSTQRKTSSMAPSASWSCPSSVDLVSTLTGWHTGWSDILATFLHGFWDQKVLVSGEISIPALFRSVSQNLPWRSASWCAGVTIAKVDSFRNKSIEIRRRDDLRGVIDWEIGPWEIIRIYNNNVWARCIVLLRFSIKPVTRSEFPENHIIIY